MKSLLTLAKTWMVLASCNENNVFWKLNIIYIKIQINAIQIYYHINYINKEI